MDDSIFLRNAHARNGGIDISRDRAIERCIRNGWRY